MSPAPSDWRPSASLETLKKRAQLLEAVRAFFSTRGVLEVETPLLSAAAAPDVHLDSVPARLHRPGIGEETRWLPTSPEYPLKRLLCAGYGDVYALGKVFRDGDESRRHQPEFTLLEWYRLDYDLPQIMAETAELLQHLLQRGVPDFFTFDELFARFAGIQDPFSAPAEAFRAVLADRGIDIAGVAPHERGLWRQLVLTEVIEPQLAARELVFVYGYPAQEAALAALHPHDPHRALRFEVYWHGMELANGYEELRDAKIYRQRFEQWNAARAAAGKRPMPLDTHLLAALEASGGLPPASGVALGFDRLVMAATGAACIDAVIAFPVPRA
ncbi:lysyl-tRNA synthetase, class 2 [Sulfurivirga caldicuralii]|uniref:Lysyl-tRNA synthetase, class 2 n=1 Tax=Sulfurivirga caldicuralii TaxID=364032 RepID=A0A1N6DS45_9GAMM|nr:EF-P lysine aminoacylase EpmA [Sulfurivirga caldicuralii]SIN73618.1 lysyl-tRNA synthetase, class 2 [Sulfurivirga caldicuralii]